MDEQPHPDVVVQDIAAIKLADHLQQVGRLNGGANQVRAQLNKAVGRLWGQKTIQAKDAVGPLWLMDLSDYFDGEMLWGIVRSQFGTRQLVAVVETDEVEQFHQTGRWNSSEALGGVDPDDIDEMPEEVQQDPRTSPRPRPFQPRRQVKESPEDPCLVVYWEGPYRESREGGDFSHDKYVRCTRSEVPDEIGRLLQLGIEERDIEVWTSVRKPKVQIAF